MISVKDLKKSFGEVQAVRGVSFDAEDGRITGLLGPNGAGKSTTLRILYTVLKPDSGSATIDGVDVVDVGSAERSQSECASCGKDQSVVCEFELFAVIASYCDLLCVGVYAVNDASNMPDVDWLKNFLQRHRHIFWVRLVEPRTHDHVFPGVNDGDFYVTGTGRVA